MDVNTLIQRAGSVTKLANMLGVAHNTVSDWKRSGFLPGNRIGQVKEVFRLEADDILGLIQPSANSKRDSSAQSSDAA